MLSKLIREIKSAWSELAAVRIVVTATLMGVAVILGMRQLAWLQPLELVAYDQLMRLRLDAGTDPRLLIVAITETDIQTQKQWPFPDRVVAQLLQQLQQYQPKVIGLDLYRDIPVEPGHEKLMAQLKKSNVIAIRNIDTLNGPPAPPSVPAERVGFNDVVIDPDGVVRRNVLFSDSDNGVLTSFSLQLALAYLQDQGILPEQGKNNPDYLQLGVTEFVQLKEDSGGYQDADANGYQILLNYRSRENVARKVSLTQVLRGEVDPSWVKGKIVLIGTTAASLKDTFYTPYSPAERQVPKMPGVVVHAQMVSQLLDAAVGTRPLFQFWSERTEILWIMAWTLVGAVVGWRSRHPLVLIFWMATGVIVLTAACLYLFTQQFVWIPTISPVLAFVLTSGVVVTYRAYEAHQQQQIVMKLLGQNTSPEVAKALWRGREHLLKAGKLPGIKLTATMMFTDIKDFSTIAEQMQPEALLEWLNELLDIITQEVLSREGIINKFTGDGVMAVFGVPMSRIHKEEVKLDAQRSVDCAMALSERLEKLNQNWNARGLPLIQMRVGIFTGPVVVGSLGGKDRLEYGVIGDSVNIASRLESCEKQRQPSNCRILIGYETLVHLNGKFLVESWGPLPLKGKQQTVDVYRVVGRLLKSA